MHHHDSLDLEHDLVKACDRCPHPLWAHGVGSICSECDASHHAGACGLLSLYGFDISTLPLDEFATA